MPAREAAMFAAMAGHTVGLADQLVQTNSVASTSPYARRRKASGRDAVLDPSSPGLHGDVVSLLTGDIASDEANASRVLLERELLDAALATAHAANAPGHPALAARLMEAAVARLESAAKACTSPTSLNCREHNDSTSRTALIIATQNNCAAAVMVLLRVGVDKELKWHSMTALDVATKLGEKVMN